MNKGLLNCSCSANTCIASTSSANLHYTNTIIASYGASTVQLHPLSAPNISSKRYQNLEIRSVECGSWVHYNWHCRLPFQAYAHMHSDFSWNVKTRRPASADRIARRQLQATGQSVSRMQASDAMTSRLPRYEAKCMQRRCFQCELVPLHSDIKGAELPPANILIPLERQLIALQHYRWEFLYNETFLQTFRPVLSKLSKRRQI